MYIAGLCGRVLGETGRIHKRKRRDAFLIYTRANRDVVSQFAAADRSAVVVGSRHRAIPAKVIRGEASLVASLHGLYDVEGSVTGLTVCFASTSRTLAQQV